MKKNEKSYTIVIVENYFKNHQYSTIGVYVNPLSQFYLSWPQSVFSIFQKVPLTQTIINWGLNSL